MHKVQQVNQPIPLVLIDPKPRLLLTRIVALARYLTSVFDAQVKDMSIPQFTLVKRYLTMNKVPTVMINTYV